jgi:DNA adenine methylase
MRPPSSDRLRLLSGRSLIGHGASILSPLRYPGAKRRLAPFISELLRVNDCRPALLIEPFAGGASVALQLLNDRVVDSIGIADRDPLIASFWKTAFFETEWLVEAVKTVSVSVTEWQRRHDSPHRGSVRDQALTCLFLNRTSFSGLLAPGAGPIGGKKQLSRWKIGCRFPRQRLAHRLRQVGALRDDVAFVWNLSWGATLSRVANMNRRRRLARPALFYLDPPFFEKADRLYRFYFNDSDHERLRDAVMGLRQEWVLSYDSYRRARRLYAPDQTSAARLHHIYSTSGAGGVWKSDEVLLTSLAKFPAVRRLWRSNQERTQRPRTPTPRRFAS